MEELQFRPNRAARALVTSKSRTIGVLASNSSEYGPAASLQAIGTAARDAGYTLDTAYLETSDRPAIIDALDRLVGHAVEGLIILAPQSRSLDMIAELSITLPFVTVHSTGGLDDHRLSVDQTAGAVLATRHLLELGHRRIVHVAGPDGWVETAARQRGFQEEMTAWGVEPPPPVHGDWTAESGYAAGRRILCENDVTAVFSSNDQMALGVLHACRDAGLEVPGNLSVVGFDDIPEAAHYWPPLTTVRQDFAELGRRCVALLVAALAGNAPEHPHDVLPELVVRQSTEPPRPG